MGWDHLCLPEVYERTHPHPVRSSIGFTDPRGEGDLLWSDRFTPEAHREREIEFGPYATAGQLQQRPAPREGGLFKKWWFVIQRAAPGGGVRARRWDLAATEKRPKSDPDWTVGVRMLKTHDGMLWIEDVVRLRGSPLEVEQAILNTARQDGMGVTQWVPQDPGAAGKMVAQRLVRLLQPYPARIAQEGEMGDKIARADPFAGQAEAGNVVLLKADWNHDFIEEFGLFPNGRHDDQVDAASGAFLALNSTGTPAIRDMIA
nr:phage terminase large subunit [Chelatococcus asaccharovorans]